MIRHGLTTRWNVFRRPDDPGRPVFERPPPHGSGYGRERFAAAYHEAGHAAVAVLLGSQLDGVELTPDHPHGSGCCRERVDDPIALARAVERGDEVVILPQIHILLAGRAAQQKGKCDWFPGGDEHDLTTAHRLAVRLGTGGDAILAEALIETRRLLNLPTVWAGVVALAEELLQRGCVDGAVAHRILFTAGIGGEVRHAANASGPL